MSQPTRYSYIPDSQLKQFTRAAFQAIAVHPDVAEHTAHALWLTSLRGVDSHGIRLLPHYVAAVEAGRINPQPNMHFTKTALATGMVDADHSFGHAAAMLAMGHALNLAQTAGIGMVLVKNSSHCGAMATYGLEAAQHDFIGLAMTAATPKVRTPNSNSPFFGTNPICIAAPMLHEDPFCFDAAPTPFSVNKVKQFREDGLTLPEGTAADKDGIPTNDAVQAFQMLPIGDYKGFGLLMMVDMLCNLLSGMPSGDDVSSMFENSLAQKRYLGHFMLAIRIDAFIDLPTFKQTLQANADKIRQQPRMNADIPVQVAGDPEKLTMQQRQRDGIPVKHLDLQRLDELATRLHITPLSANT